MSGVWKLGRKDMNEIRLGKLIEGEAARDAVHVAIAPVVADCVLLPGNRVGLLPGTTDRATIATTDPIGIVDPFLADVVKPGQRFYLFLFPNTVTSLRHEWTHPAFTALAPDAKAAAEKWLREYAVAMNCYDDPDKAFHRLIDGLRNKELFAHGSDLHSLDELDDADELRRHAEEYLGVPVNWGDFSFSCSC